MINKAEKSLKILIGRNGISAEQKNRLVLINKVYKTNE